MSEQDDYKPTMFDRHGPEAMQRVFAFAYGLMTAGLVIGVLLTQVHFRWWLLPVGAMAGALVGMSGFLLGEGAGGTYKTLMVNGSSTPYVEQYSYQQSLVMAGKLDEALESFEAVIAEKPDAIDPRIKAAELYDREKKNYARAAELFRQVLRIETITSGPFVYATHRLVDLYTGPLDEPGRALGELRRLIDRYPGSPAAENARSALATLKARYHTPT